MLSGRCLCGTVRFELHGKRGPLRAFCRTRGRALAHFWVSSEAAWLDIADDLAQHPEGSVTR